MGGINAAAAFGGGFPMSSSASRSFVPASLGSRTQLSAVVTFAAVGVFLLVGQPLLERIPRAALAAVVIAAAFAVIDVEGFRRLAGISRTETALAAVTTLAVITTDLLTGVLLAVALSAVITLSQVARPHDAILGEGAGLDGWIDVADERSRTLPGLLVYRFDAPLFFGNVGYFEERIELLLEQNPGTERHVVLDLEGIGSIDTTAAEELIDLVESLQGRGIGVSLARVIATSWVSSSAAGSATSSATSTSTQRSTPPSRPTGADTSDAPPATPPRGQVRRLPRPARASMAA